MSVNILKREALREHEYLHVVQKLGKLLRRAVSTLVLRRHPRLRGLLDELFSDRVHTSVQALDSAGAFWSADRLLTELSEQAVEILHTT